MKKHIFALTATSLLLLPFAVDANASKYVTQDLSVENSQLAQNNPDRGQKRGKRDGMKKLLQELDLTSEQSSQIETIRDRTRQEKETLHEELQAQKETMQSLLSSDASRNELLAQHQTMQGLHQQLSNIRFESMLEVREILTSEQRAEMAELMEDFRGRRGRR